MKTRIIYTRFWIDEYIGGLSHKEKLAFIYFFTNERVNICGVYECPDKYIKLDLDLTQKELDSIKQKFMKDNKFIFIDGWIKIVNHNEYNSFTGPLNEKAIEKELSSIPEKIINYTDSDRVSIGYQYPMHTLNNTNTNTNTSYKGVVKGENKAEIIFNRDTEKWENIQDKHIDNWLKAYPACDIPTELRRMKEWILANGAKGYKSNWYKFIINWLSKSQDRGGSKYV